MPVVMGVCMESGSEVGLIVMAWREYSERELEDA